MDQLIQLISKNEDWLIKRVLGYAKKLGYAKYTSTHQEYWRLSISGFSGSLVKGIELYNDIPELGPDENFEDDPLTDFGCVEAKKYRQRGITLSMFLGLMKYYKQSYIDLVEDKCKAKDKENCKLFLERCFDRIEIAFCQEWAKIDDQKLFEELQGTNRSLTNEKNLYLTSFESFQEPVILLDKQSNVINFNQAASQLINYDLPENYSERSTLQNKKSLVIGKHIMELFPWVFGNVVQFDKDLYEGDLSVCEAEIDGHRKYFEIKCSAMQDVSEKFVASIIILRDITLRREAAMALKENERVLKSIFRAAPTGIGLIFDRTFKKVNDAMCQMIGYSRQELIEKNVLMVYPSQQEYDHVGDIQDEQLFQKGVSVIETKWKHKDGRVIDVLLSLSPVDVSDVNAGVTFTALDITERNRTRESIKAIFDAAPVGMLMLGEGAVIKQANFSVAKMLGKEIKELVGISLGDGLSCVSVAEYSYQCGQGPQCAECMIMNAFTVALNEDTIVRDLEIQPLLILNGKRTNPWFEINANSILLGKDKYVVMSIGDITERKKAEKKIKDAIAMKSNFISMVSHELRTPLTAIKEGIAIVHDEATGPINDDQREFLEIAKRNVDRLARLINDVLDFQKLESGKVDFDLQNNDINQIAKEVYESMNNVSRSIDVEFNLELAQELPDVRSDHDKIIQVLTNLVSNAMKFVDEGSVTIKTISKADAVEVIVSDTGIGIRQEDVPKVFQEFEQLGKHGGRKIGGTGLGLAISKEIIQKHKGDIWVESKYGKGSSFHFTLPVQLSGEKHG